MKRLTGTLTLTLSILLCVLFLRPYRSSAAGVIKITTVKQLDAISENLDGNYILMKNLNLGSSKWLPLGTALEPFTGTFNGNGHTITIQKTAAKDNYQGLFGFTDGATIRNLTIKGTVSGANYVAAIAGHTVDTTICNCSNKATIKGKNNVGGLVGVGNSVLIYNCQNNGSVKASGKICGGIAGNISSASSIKNCLNTGNITGGTSITGGIAGKALDATIENCVNHANVKGKETCGGITATKTGNFFNNYFKKTKKTNVDYKIYGINSATYEVPNGNLNQKVIVGTTARICLPVALNNWVIQNNSSGKIYRYWKATSKTIKFL